MTLTKPFYSAEVRWFSDERESLYNIYESLPGDSILESDRIDYYLNSNSESVGIKLREENHEIKCKVVDDAVFDQCNLETWVKWSYKQKDFSILKLVDNKMMNDWIEVDKKRWKKKYEVYGKDKVRYNNAKLDEGCGVEFTEILVEGKQFFTLGLEAFTSSEKFDENYLENAMKNLILVLSFLGFKTKIKNKHFCASYPKFLKDKIL